MVNKFLRYATLGCAAVVSQLMFAQTSSDLRFNEVYFSNDSSSRGAWVEIFNTSYTAVDMARLYLSNDRAQLDKFCIPQGLLHTKFDPRGFQIVALDGRPDKGALHTRFRVWPGQWLYLVESNGTVILDSVQIPRNGAMARALDGVGPWETPKEISHGFSNEMAVVVKTADKFAKIDPHGGGMSMISIGVVFSVLVLLAVVFTFTGKFFMWLTAQENSPKAQAAHQAAADAKHKADETLAAAIAMAVHLHLTNTHDDAVGEIVLKQKENSRWRYSFRRH